MTPALPAWWPAPKRGRVLLALGVAEIGLGLSYAVDTTRTREALFSWLPGPLHIETFGWVIVLCGLLGVIAAFARLRSPRWDRIGWMAIGVAPALMALLWAWTALMATVDAEEAFTSPWTPWATTLVYTSWWVVASTAADWPDPLALTSPHPQEAP